LIETAKTKNICTEIMNYEGKELDRCELALDGSLTKGLTVAVRKYIDDYNNDYKSTDFE